MGHQKRTTYALRPDMSREEFIKELLTGLTTPPGYFPKNVLMNIQGYESLDTIMERGKRELDPTAFEVVANEERPLVLDARDASDFKPRASSRTASTSGLEGNFAMWIGEMVPDIKQPILLVTYPGKEEEAIIRLSRVGYDNTIGYLKGGFDAWKAAGRRWTP